MTIVTKSTIDHSPAIFQRAADRDPPIYRLRENHRAFGRLRGLFEQQSHRPELQARRNQGTAAGQGSLDRIASKAFPAWGEGRVLSWCSSFLSKPGMGTGFPAVSGRAPLTIDNL